MKTTALFIIEDAFEIVLNPTLPYFIQLEPLGANGELSNRNNLNKVLFKLCELVDAQAKEIDSLKVDILGLRTPVPPVVDVKNPDPTKPITNSTL